MENNIFGGWSIEKECFEFINNILKENSTILEFGSGRVSEILNKKFNVYSVEHDKKWVNRYKTNYIYSPLKKYKDLKYEWYDIDILKNKLPKEIDLILIDGPPAGKNKPEARHGFLYFYDELFKRYENLILIFDDIQREGDMNLMVKVSELLNIEYEIYKNDKMFGVIKIF